jgi:hypothetical protein
VSGTENFLGTRNDSEGGRSTQEPIDPQRPSFANAESGQGSGCPENLSRESLKTPSVFDQPRPSSTCSADGCFRNRRGSSQLASEAVGMESVREPRYRTSPVATSVVGSAEKPLRSTLRRYSIPTSFGWMSGTISATGLSRAPHERRLLGVLGSLQISSRSLPTTIVPRNCERAASIHIWSVTCGSSAGTKCERTSVFTPAACAMRPAFSADV